MPQDSSNDLARWWDLPDWPFVTFEESDLKWLIPLGLAKAKPIRIISGHQIMDIRHSMIFTDSF